MASKNSELVNDLNEIANKSAAGEIPWTQPNPSTFRWDRMKKGRPLVVYIQRAKRLKRLKSGPIGPTTFDKEYTFLFEVKTQAQTLLSIDTGIRPELKDVLSRIYNGAVTGADKHASKILKSLLTE
ncbi:hypothetical protein D3OALGA1CA_5709 [Olavius algarvensis associated proteobacterium Delta 3]|nr:hypothetical protein D3OALGB2SA_2467 [Olavius algarvensis associated proteobacterium Delta 3]CAB5170656.1 hypothetical protein D3OALGA1CA_5709 [Olavius algarvensis associated proteobacterium Delta 3]